MKIPESIFNENILLKLILVVAFGLSISLMISPGALVQQAFLSIFDHDARTIYQSIHGNSINRYPNLGDWLLGAFHPMFLFVSFSTSIFVVLMSSFRKFFMALWLGTAAGLSGLDIVNGILMSDETFSVLIQNLVANSIGGVALALVSSVIAITTEMLFRNGNMGRISKVVISAIGIVSIGLLSSVFLYMSIVVILHPLPIEVRIVTTLPVSGTFGTERPLPSQKLSDNPFALIPTDAQLHRSQLLGFDNLEFRWHKTHDDTTFSLSLYAVSECGLGSELEDLSSEKAVFSKSDVKKVRILGDATGRRELQVDGEQSEILISEAQTRSITTFWLEEGVTNSSLRITQLLGENVKVLAKTSGSITVMMTGILLDRGDERSHLVQRHFSLIVDGEEKRITFVPVAKIPEDGRPECEILSNKSSNSEKFQFDEQMMAGIIIHLQRTGTPSGYLNDFDGQFDLIHPNGWFTAPSVDWKQLPRRGKMALIDLPGSIGEFDIEDIPQEFSHSQRFHGWGDLTASYVDNGRLMINGVYRAAWIGSKRLNPTRWESWPYGYKIALLTALLGVPAGLFSMVMRLWQEDRPLSWSG